MGICRYFNLAMALCRGQQVQATTTCVRLATVIAQSDRPQTQSRLARLALCSGVKKEASDKLFHRRMDKSRQSTVGVFFAQPPGMLQSRHNSDHFSSGINRRCRHRIHRILCHWAMSRRGFYCWLILSAKFCLVLSRSGLLRTVLVLRLPTKWLLQSRARPAQATANFSGTT
jgi:hypothetical protein